MIYLQVDDFKANNCEVPSIEQAQKPEWMAIWFSIHSQLSSSILAKRSQPPMWVFGGGGVLIVVLHFRIALISYSLCLWLCINFE